MLECTVVRGSAELTIRRIAGCNKVFSQNLCMLWKPQCFNVEIATSIHGALEKIENGTALKGQKETAAHVGVAA